LRAADCEAWEEETDQVGDESAVLLEEEREGGRFVSSLEKFVVTQTEKSRAGYRPGFTSVWDAAEMVDLDVAYSPVLLSGSIRPKTVSKLGNGKYAIYDVGYSLANMGNNWWNISAEELKIERARFLLQRDVFYQDMVMKRRSPKSFLRFRTYTGAAIVSPPDYVIESTIIPLFFPGGVAINSLMSEHIAKSYIYADGTVETASF
jgi:hypothetical protein